MAYENNNGLQLMILLVVLLVWPVLDRLILAGLAHVSVDSLWVDWDESVLSDFIPKSGNLLAIGWGDGAEYLSSTGRLAGACSHVSRGF